MVFSKIRLTQPPLYCWALFSTEVISWCWQEVQEHKNLMCGHRRGKNLPLLFHAGEGSVCGKASHSLPSWHAYHTKSSYSVSSSWQLLQGIQPPLSALSRGDETPPEWHVTFFNAHSLDVGPGSFFFRISFFSVFGGRVVGFGVVVYSRQVEPTVSMKMRHGTIQLQPPFFHAPA